MIPFNCIILVIIAVALNSIKSLLTPKFDGNIMLCLKSIMICTTFHFLPLKYYPLINIKLLILYKMYKIYKHSYFLSQFSILSKIKWINQPFIAKLLERQEVKTTMK